MQTEWAGLRSVCRVDSKRTVKGVESRETRYYISSLRVNPEQALKAIRAHWGVENKLHWVLDVEFGEDGTFGRVTSKESSIFSIQIRRQAWILKIEN